MAKDLAIVLNSGSINSAVVTALATQKHRVVLLHADTSPVDVSAGALNAYGGQMASFKTFREHTLPMPFLSTIHDKTLASGGHDPRLAKPTLPALRDLTPFLGLAVTYALAYEANAIYVGLRMGPEIDGLARATEYFQIWNEMLQLTLGRPELEVVAPLLDLEPWQVIDLGFQVNAPLDRTWSCTDGASDACGSCRGCRSRDAAFMQAAKPDPLKPARR
ncbi:MAG TPA: 7-cyano-7-deazaguanine synthase [Tepidisphaeraceae bacterium]|jgi:7-cyano-7-deazaguanine synthase